MKTLPNCRPHTIHVGVIIKLYYEKQPIWFALRCRDCKISNVSLLFHSDNTMWSPWASCQIPEIAGCACAGNAGNVFPVAELYRKPLFSNPGMHRGTCGTHVPWCMPGSLTRGGGENVPGIPGACATRNFTYLVRGPWVQAMSVAFFGSKNADLLSTASSRRGVTKILEKITRILTLKMHLKMSVVNCRQLWSCITGRDRLRLTALTTNHHGGGANREFWKTLVYTSDAHVRWNPCERWSSSYHDGIKFDCEVLS